MFEKKVIEAYRQVKAPVELKERVMESYQTKPTNVTNLRLYKTLLVIAACLVLVFSGTAFGNRGNVSVLFNGEVLSGQPVAVSEFGSAASQGVAMASLERSAPVDMCIPLEVETWQDTTLTVSDGEMQVFASDTGELLFAGTEYTTSGKVSVEWYVETGKEAYMSVVSAGKELFIQLEYSEAEDMWMISQK